jgi:hypothetical protein
VLLLTFCVRNGAVIGVKASDDENTIAAATIARMDDVVENIMIYMNCCFYNNTIVIFLFDNKALFET